MPKREENALILERWFQVLHPRGLSGRIPLPAPHVVRLVGASACRTPIRREHLRRSMENTADARPFTRSHGSNRSRNFSEAATMDSSSTMQAPNARAKHHGKVILTSETFALSAIACECSYHHTHSPSQSFLWDVQGSRMRCARSYFHADPAFERISSFQLVTERPTFSTWTNCSIAPRSRRDLAFHNSLELCVVQKHGGETKKATSSK